MRPLLLAATLAVGMLACARSGQVEPGTTPAPEPTHATARITSADQLLAAMHDRYAKDWYRTLTFVQTSTYLKDDGTPSRVETWYESAALPGRLRIDLGEPSRGNGVIYSGDSVLTVQGGRVVDRRAGSNPLLILGFDVYTQPVSRSMQALAAEHIDMTVLRTDTLYGGPVYVVGAGPRDSTTNQFWIDANRMLFVRLLQTDPRRKVTRDIRFENYVRHGGGWVAERVRFLSGGHENFREEYADVKVGVPLSDDLFVPEHWTTAPHWHTP